ncbi:MlaD family protein [Gordonia paraffinivorans]|uniref:MlaD family protein n=1 Tax=Gordonia paraffinivorans TaxID=175628 RepID=UPI001445E7AF|nr:MlaD family protein [Gordonia paraffinivorans]
MTARRSRILTVAVSLLCCVLTGCSVGLGQLPLPAPGARGEGFGLRAQFENALNLPAKAKVRLLGADVGFVESMTVDDYLADVGMRIADGTRLPEGTRAELRSATPLGDVFVALEPPADPDPTARLLGDGDVIPVDRTSAGATVEEVLSTAAMLVNGGAIRSLTDLVNGLGESLGDDGRQLGSLIRESTVLVSSLSERTDEIDQVLGAASRLASTVSARQQTIDTAIAAAGPALWTVANNTQQILSTVDQADRIIRQLGAFPSVKGGAAGGMMDDINRIAASLNAAATAPGASLAAVNRILGPIIKLTNATSGHTDVAISQFALGAFDDPNHKGDPGSRLPDMRDWQQFVGSLSVTLMRIRQHVQPPQKPGAPR